MTLSVIATVMKYQDVIFLETMKRKSEELRQLVYMYCDDFGV